MTNYLFDALYAKAAADRRFLETEEGRVITYADLRDETGRIAAALVALGVGPGSRVAAQIEKSPDGIMLYLACVRAGAIFLPLNTAYTVAELAYFIGDAEPAVIVVDPSRAEAFSEVAKSAGATLVTLSQDGEGTLADLVRRQAPDFRDAVRGPDDLAALLYTSGTTGRSKGAMLSHGNLASNAEALVDTWRFAAEDVLIHALPIFHTHGLFVATNVILMAGASMLFQRKFAPDRIVAALPRATSLMGVPTFYVRLLDYPGIDRESTAGMRIFISGSAPLLSETHVRWKERTGHAILERYGMTETNMIASNPYEGDRRPGTVGFPLPGMSVRVTEPETGKALPQGGVGMIEVSGPSVFKGYWRMPEKTKAEFRQDGFFITGDLGKIDADGYLHIVGRGKDLIIAGGYNIYPKEIELVVDALPGVAESAVIGVPHPDLGEGVTAVVVCNPKTVLTSEDVLAGLSDQLARFKHPKRVVFVDELPRNTMGKVQKNVLRERFAHLFVDG